MPLIDLDLPPGVFKNGTDYQSKGRCNDANLFRWRDGANGPIGGWRSHSSSAVTGAARAIITWKDLNGSAQIGIGTESHLYNMTRSGALTDITPTGLIPGRKDATSGAGYGTLTYGSFTYGTPRPDTSSILDATVWSLDTFGQDLVAVNDDDQRIYEWVPDTTTPAAPVANAPTASSLIVTAERFLMALSAGGDPRLVQWSDQEDDTSWTPSLTNQAGQFPLQTGGRLMCGKRINGATLLFTDTDLWEATYIGFPLVYGFARAGDGCGIISRGAAAALDSRAVWMGANGFYLYNGFVAPLPCDVSDFVFNGINRAQVSKVTCFNNSTFSEVWWFYPSANSLELDRYVVWNYNPVSPYWNIGALTRLSAQDRGIFQYPLMMGPDGIVYEHEVGLNFDGAEPFVRRGPLELGMGDRFANARTLIPDGLTAGDVTATFYTKEYPTGPERVQGPYPLDSNTDVRFSARQAEVQFTGATATNWRVGIPRLEVVQGGGR